MNLKVEIERDASIRGYAIWITNDRPDGKTQLAKPVQFEFVDDDPGVNAEPTICLPGRDSDDFLRGFATALAASGFKADELKHIDQQISALKYHLEDMRKLVFKDKYGVV